MRTRLIASAALLAAAIALPGCKDQAAPVPVPHAERFAHEGEAHAPAPRPAFRPAVTWRGRPGIEIAPGIVWGMDGRISVGISF